MIDTYYTDLDPGRWALRVLALLALGGGITSLYLLVVPRWPWLHRAGMVLVLISFGALILLFGVGDIRVKVFGITFLGLATGIAARLRIAEWALAILATAAFGVTLSRWVEIFLDALEHGYADLGGQGDVTRAAIEVYCPMIMLACVATGRLRPPPEASLRDKHTATRQPLGGP